MSHRLKMISLVAMVVVVLVIPIYTWVEPIRQQELLLDYQAEAVLSATDLYAENCALCHGAYGEGIGDNPPLATDALRSTLDSDLVKIISRGLTNTIMAAWAVEEGGVLSNAQVNNLVSLIQFGNWEYVGQRVTELGLTPPELIAFEISEDMLASLTVLPDGEQLGEGLTIYAENCSACHNANGSGTLIAPAIDTLEVREIPQEELIKVINNGIPGTLMTSWQNSLSQDQIISVANLIYRWPEVIQSGIEFPETGMAALPSSPEMIADGERLFQIACQACHGSDAYGTRMAPALNNQIFLTQTPDAAIYQIIAGGVTQTLMPAWGSRLTDYDIQTLVAYFRSLESTAPPIVPPILAP